MDREVLTEKIRKLLALAKSPNQYEAELAMQKANQLMTEHQISMSTIDIENLRTSDVAVGQTIHVSETYRSFIRLIARAASKVFDCQDIGTGEQSTLFFVGQKEDVLYAEILFKHLFESWKSIVAEDTKNWRLQLWSAPRQYAVKQYKISHGQGFATAVLQRAKALETARQQEVKIYTGTDLVVLKNALVNTWVDKHTQSSKARYKQQQGGFEEGYTAGQRIPLSTAINQTKKEIEHG